MSFLDWFSKKSPHYHVISKEDFISILPDRVHADAQGSLVIDDNEFIMVSLMRYFPQDTKVEPEIFTLFYKNHIYICDLLYKDGEPCVEFKGFELQLRKFKSMKSSTILNVPMAEQE